MREFTKQDRIDELETEIAEIYVRLQPAIDAGDLGRIQDVCHYVGNIHLGSPEATTFISVAKKISVAKQTANESPCLNNRQLEQQDYVRGVILEAWNNFVTKRGKSWEMTLS